MKSNNTTIVVLDYKSAEKTVTYAKHLVEKIKGSFRIVVVDNSVDADNSNYIIDALDMRSAKNFDNYEVFGGRLCDVDIYLYVSPINGGYAIGNNIGAQIAKALDSDYLIFSNNDIVIIDSELDLDILLNPFKDDEVGIIGPCIIGKDGINQSPYRFVSFTKRWIMYPLVYPLNKYFKKLRFNDDLIRDDFYDDVYRVMGAFIVVREHFFEKINGFDENTFLYGEELILSERMKRIGARTIFCDDVKLLHDHDMTIGKYYDNSQKTSLQYKSEYYFYKEYMNTNSFSLFMSKVCVKLLIFKIRLIGNIVGGRSVR